MTQLPAGAQEAAHEPVGRRSHAPRTGIAVAIAVVFGLFYAYDVWEAVGNLIGLNMTAGALDTRLSAFGWAVLLAGVLLPFVIYAGAAWLGRYRGARARILLLLCGLCLVAVLSLDIFVVFGVGSLIV